MNLNEESLKLHEENRGKIEVVSKTEIKDMHDLAVVYTPGVAEPCRKIHQDTSLVYKYTNKGNMVAVVSDGTAVLGLGDICLLYTSDAADEEDSVDLGGRRIIKKKKKKRR